MVGKLRRFFGRVMVTGAAIHEIGGACMGDDPATSVPNGWGQGWDAPNLDVTDANAFAGSGVSGTTPNVMAQAVQAGRHLARSAGAPPGWPSPPPWSPPAVAAAKPGIAGAEPRRPA